VHFLGAGEAGEAAIAAGVFRQKASRHLPRHLLFRVLAYRLQADRLGDLDAEYKRLLDGAATFEDAGQRAVNEALVLKAVRNHLGEINDTDDRDLINNHVARIEAQSDKLIVELAKTKAVSPKRRGRPDRIEIPWRKTPLKRRREILIPEPQHQQEVRPIRSENRAMLVASIARGRRWLDELIADPATNAESTADREGCTTRQVKLTISLAFLAPTSSRQPSRDNYRTDWSSPASRYAIGMASSKADARALGDRAERNPA
jgi:hypothetical protein